MTLGGDGTNRAFARAARDVNLIPLSTGTNNVFPTLVEPTIAGMVAGLAARGENGYAPRNAASSCTYVSRTASRTWASSTRHCSKAISSATSCRFDAAKLSRLLLTRAEPDAIGMSPIGGLLEVVDAKDDAGLLVEVGPGRPVNAPLSPGLFEQVEVSGVTRIPFDTPVVFQGQGVLALDGDRDHWLRHGRSATVSIRRDGPWVIDVPGAMRLGGGERDCSATGAARSKGSGLAFWRGVGWRLSQMPVLQPDEQVSPAG